VYNHGDTVGETLDRLAATGVPVLVVDDGSQLSHRQQIERACAGRACVRLIRHERNLGKGGAVQTGLRHLDRDGFSHGFQVDADLQHDLARAGALLAAANERPHCIVLGVPEFDASIPPVRRYSRYLTHLWVWINTLSFEIRDSMCGFRVYPVAPVVELIDASHPGLHMEFDTEILVRWKWAGGAIANIPVATHYPTQGRSHFRPWRDNLLIRAMHARLFFGMLVRLPALVSERRAREA
jgi:glycosyltransferase involved in cell wall biosynthesis